MGSCNYIGQKHFTQKALIFSFSFSLRDKMLKKYLKSIFSIKHYPKIIQQKDVIPNGVQFEVTNEIEEWRVNSLDDEQEFLKELIDSLHPEDVFCDIGCCIGIFSIHAAAHCRLVYGVEPDPGFLKRIERNIKLNHIKNITTLPLAISDKAGEVVLYTDGIDGRSPSLENLGQKSEVQVQCSSLDILIEENQIQYPDILKIDIEGAEYHALKGAQNLLRSNKPPRLIFLEVHPRFLQKFGHSAEELEDFLYSHNYGTIKKSVRDTQYHITLAKIN